MQGLDICAHLQAEGIARVLVLDRKPTGTTRPPLQIAIASLNSSGEFQMQLQCH